MGVSVSMFPVLGLSLLHAGFSPDVGHPNSGLHASSTLLTRLFPVLSCPIYSHLGQMPTTGKHKNNPVLSPWDSLLTRDLLSGFCAFFFPQKTMSLKLYFSSLMDMVTIYFLIELLTRAILEAGFHSEEQEGYFVPFGSGGAWGIISVFLSGHLLPVP